jgi:hypothetical protein
MELQMIDIVKFSIGVFLAIGGWVTDSHDKKFRSCFHGFKPIE